MKGFVVILAMLCGALISNSDCAAQTKKQAEGMVNKITAAFKTGNDSLVGACLPTVEEIRKGMAMENPEDIAGMPDAAVLHEELVVAAKQAFATTVRVGKSKKVQWDKIQLVGYELKDLEKDETGVTSGNLYITYMAGTIKFRVKVIDIGFFLGNWRMGVEMEFDKVLE